MSDLYAERDIIEQEEFYTRHVSAMTKEGLDRKSDIAAELAHRDISIERLQARVATLELAAQSDEPDLVWDYENQQDPGYEPQKIVDTLADRMNSGESHLFAVACAKRMPNREMHVSVSEDGEVSWYWVNYSDQELAQ